MFITPFQGGFGELSYSWAWNKNDLFYNDLRFNWIIQQFQTSLIHEIRQPQPIHK